MQCFFFGFSVVRFCVEISPEPQSVLQRKYGLIKSLFALGGADSLHNLCYPSGVAGDAGFSALCVHPAAGCETSSQPNFSQISSGSLLLERPKSVQRQFPLG